MASTFVRRLAALGTAAVLTVLPMAVAPSAAHAAPAAAVAQAGPPAPAAQPGGGESHTNAGYWEFVAPFPDPVTCAIAGATSGRQFYCGFYFFFWGLNLWHA